VIICATRTWRPVLRHWVSTRIENGRICLMFEREGSSRANDLADIGVSGDAQVFDQDPTPQRTGRAKGALC